MKHPDLAELRLRLTQAGSVTKEEKGKRIPMPTFLDIDYGQRYENSERERSEFAVQLGFSLPVWSLFKNKAIDASKRVGVGICPRRVKQCQFANVETDVRRQLWLVQEDRADICLSSANSLPRHRRRSISRWPTWKTPKTPINCPRCGLKLTSS